MALILRKSKYIYFIAKATCNPHPNVGTEKGKGKSVSFALSDASGVATPTDTNSEMGKFSDSYNDKLTNENLSNLSQQTAEKVSVFDFGLEDAIIYIFMIIAMLLLHFFNFIIVLLLRNNIKIFRNIMIMRACTMRGNHQSMLLNNHQNQVLEKSDHL